MHNTGVLDLDPKTLTVYKWDHSKIKEYKTNFKNKNCQATLDQLLMNTVDPRFNSSKLCKIYYEFLNYAISNTFKIKNSKGLKLSYK